MLVDYQFPHSDTDLSLDTECYLSLHDPTDGL
jgi:hypothetical protein